VEPARDVHAASYSAGLGTFQWVVLVDPDWGKAVFDGQSESKTIIDGQWEM
jgi:hypothetical protein